MTNLDIHRSSTIECCSVIAMQPGSPQRPIFQKTLGKSYDQDFVAVSCGGEAGQAKVFLPRKACRPPESSRCRHPDFEKRGSARLRKEASRQKRQKGQRGGRTCAVSPPGGRSWRGYSGRPRGKAAETRHGSIIYSERRRPGTAGAVPVCQTFPRWFWGWLQ